MTNISAKARWLLSVTPAALMLFLPGIARGQAGAATASCEPLARDLASAQAELERTRQDLESARGQASEVESIRSRTEQAERERDERGASLNSCRAAQEDLCTAAGGFAGGILAGRVNVDGLASCVDPTVRRGLAEQLSGWSNTSAALGRFGAFSAGEIDTTPGMGPTSGSKVERLVARLFAQGNGSPQIYRRLVIEALKLTAPRSLSAIRAQAGGLERWFQGADPLDARLVAEVTMGESTKNAQTRTPVLATATSLVNSYQLLAGCQGPQPARDCRRAEQLSQLLERSGPLITRRRVQDVWASECSALTADVVKTWLMALPPTTASDSGVETVSQAVRAKLFACFLRDATAPAHFSEWLYTKLPTPSTQISGAFAPLLDLGTWWRSDSPVDVCARAVRALQAAPAQNQCLALPSLLSTVRAWAAARNDVERDFGFEMCDRLGLGLWRGESVSVPDTFPAPPTVDDVVRQREGGARTNIARLRDACGARVGNGVAFEQAVSDLGRLANLLGESVSHSPWGLTADFEPVERRRGQSAGDTATWFRSLSRPTMACEVMELTDERCAACRHLPEDSHYDCALARRLEASWGATTRRVLLASLGLTSALLVALWATRMRRAVVAQRSWLAQVSAFLRRLGLHPQLDRWRFFVPGRVGSVELILPETPTWERFGRRAVLVRCESGSFRARDVERAGGAARRSGAELALLVHDDAISPDLPAVRAMLDWAARGPGKAVHVLPLMWSRLEWSQDIRELLELAEESSLRSNPFEVRGRVTSSTQFFDRERLVSGLLASVQAGHFTVVTGLRRLGKSSLALEVLRRLPGPAAYLDLTGFHYEIHRSQEPTEAADAILRYLCLELLESARNRHAGKPFELEVPSGAIDATALAAWLRDFDRLLAKLENGKAPPALLILDELEHAIGAAPALDRALEVFAIVVGRLRNALPAAGSSRRQRVGVIFCSALHPLLWSPLGTLAHQSLIGSFEQVAVPCLPEDAAAAMMRALGSRQGIRFTSAALDLLVAESQGVPLLLRRLGTAVLELYDPERARQGSLGAVEIGVEGARAAVEREVSEGSPVRVWVESEIAAPDSPGGAVLRFLAQRERGPAVQLRKVAAEVFLRQFELTGLALELTAGEARRRAEEAAAVVVRTLGESGLLRADGDPTEPEVYLLPDGVIRRALGAATS
jgi:hypothetical protein